MSLDRAATLRNAEKLLRQGKLEPAIAEYVRVLEDQPRDWNTANTLGDLYVRGGRVDQAIEQFLRIADGLHDDGFLPKAAAVYKKILKLKPDHEHALTRAAEIAAGQGLHADARAHLGAIIQLRETRGDARGAAETRIRLAELDPSDYATRRDAVRARVSIGENDAALQELKTIARELTERGREDEALDALSAAQGLASEDRELRLSIAEIHLRAGRVDEGLAPLRLVLQADSAQWEAVALVGWNVGAAAPDAAYRAVELAADTSASNGDWAAAAAVLQEFATRVPNHVPALLRLVEIAVDGSLESTMYSAQAQLADAYLAAGSASEARFISEDLVAREPWDAANIERYRQALILSGEADPDKIIADRLSGDSPFVASDLHFDPLEPAPTTPSPAASASDEPAAAPAPPAPAVEPSGASPSAIGAAFTPVEASAPNFEDIEDVFERLRQETSRRTVLEAAESDYRRALAQHESGDIDGCIASLVSASRSPKLRFVTAAMLGRLHKGRGAVPQAIEWFERAAQAPPPAPADYHELLLDLADALEIGGETVRALAVCLELQADAGDYRDVAARVERLSKVQTRG